MKWRADSKWIVGLALMVVGFWVSLQVVNPGYFLNDDNGNYFLGMWVHNWRAVVEQRTIPLINLHQSLGSTHIYQGQAGVLYLPNYVAMAISKLVSGEVYAGIGLVILGHWLAAAVGLWVLTGEWVRSKQLRMAAGLLLVVVPMVANGSRSWLVLAYLAGFASWSLWLTWRLLVKPSKRLVVAMIGLKSLVWFSGYPQWIVVLGLADLMMVGWWLWSKPDLKLVKQRLSSYCWAVGISCLLAAPIIYTGYQGAVRSVARSQPVDTPELVKIRMEPWDWLMAQVAVFNVESVFNAGGYLFFVGSVGWVVIMVAGWQGGWRERKGWLGLAIMWLVWWWWSTKWFSLIAWLPVVSWFRWPVKHVVILVTIYCLWLVVSAQRVRRVWRRESMVLVWLTVGLAALVSIRHAEDKYGFSGDNAGVEEEVGWLEMVVNNPKRVVTFGVDLKRHDGWQLANFNYASVLNIDSFGGHDAVMPMRSWLNTKGIPAFGVLDKTVEPEVAGYLQDWGVGYWITNQPIAAELMLESYKNLREVYRNDAIVVLEDSQAKPLVSLWETGEEVESVKEINSIRATSERAGRLVFNVAFWPEYQAWNEYGQLVVEEYLGRPSVQVSEQRQTVTLSYVDAGFTTSWVITGVGVMMGWWYVKWRFNGSDGDGRLRSRQLVVRPKSKFRKR